MAVLHDNSAKSAAQSAVASGTAFTWLQTVAAGTYAVIAALATSQSTMTSAATDVVTLGSATLPRLGAVSMNNQAGETLFVFGGYTIGSGSQTASVKLTQAGTNFYGFGTADTYFNVAKVGALHTAFGSSAAASVVVPSTPGGMVWGAIDVNAGSSPFTGFPLTQRQTDTTSLAAFSFITGDGPGAASVTVNATITSQWWAAAGLSLIPVALRRGFGSVAVMRSSLY